MRLAKETLVAWRERVVARVPLAARISPSAFVVGGALLCLLFASIVMYWLSHQAGYPVWAYLTAHYDRFGDFTHPYNNELTGAYYSPNLFFAQPGFSQVDAPITILVFLVLIHLPAYSALYLFLGVISALAAFFLFALSGRSVVTTVLLLVSFPYLFVIARANQDLMCLVLIAAAYWCLSTDHDVAAAVLIGIAGAFKVPYAMSLLLVLARRHYRGTAIGVLVLAAVGFLPLYATGYGIGTQIHVFQQINANYVPAYVYGDAASMFNYSVFGAFKELAYLFDRAVTFSPASASAMAHSIANWYTPAVAVIGIGVAIWVLRHPSSWERGYLMITCAVILLPYVSGAYRLIFLFPAIARFAARRDWLARPLEIMTFVLLVVALLPKEIPWFHFPFSGQGMSGATLMNAVLLTAVMVCCVLGARSDGPPTALLGAGRLGVLAGSLASLRTGAGQAIRSHRRLT